MGVCPDEGKGDKKPVSFCPEKIEQKGQQEPEEDMGPGV